MDLFPCLLSSFVRSNVEVVPAVVVMLAVEVEVVAGSLRKVRNKHVVCNNCNNNKIRIDARVE